MKKTLHSKSKKIRSRIEAIIDQIKSYKHTIKLLDGYASGSLRLEGKNYADGAINYKRTVEDNKRYFITIKQVTLQIALLEKELETLIEYGV